MSGWPTPNTLDTVDRVGLRPSRIATNRESGYLTEMVTHVKTAASDEGNADATAEARVMRLKGYGNAIVAPAAQTFIETVMECIA